MNLPNIRVAIVEDVDEIRQSMQILINGSVGMECSNVFANGEDAVSGMPTEEIDVVLMDIGLPGMNGVECMKIMKERMPAAQFMMCTVNDDDDNIFSALQSGATGYILKRTSPAQILEAVRDLHAGGSPMSSEIARRVVASLHQKRKHNELAQVLTLREKEILELLAKGYLYKEIAAELFISRETVKKHIHHIYEKLHVQTRTEALNKVFNR